MEIKEKLAWKTRLKELEALDRDCTSLSSKFIFGIFGAALTFISLILTGKIIVPFNGLVFFAILFTSAVLATIYLQKQDEKYISDNYNKLFKYLKEDKIFEVGITPRTGFELVYYRRKY
jgi:hypothetical protein